MAKGRGRGGGKRVGKTKSSGGRGRTPARQFAETFLEQQSEQNPQTGARVAGGSRQGKEVTSYRGDEMRPVPSAIRNNAMRYGKTTNLRDEAQSVDQRFRKHGSGLPGLALSIDRLNQGTHPYDHKTGKPKFQGRGREGNQRRSRKIVEV